VGNRVKIFSTAVKEDRRLEVLPIAEAVHYDETSQAPDSPQIPDFPEDFRHLDCMGHF